MENGVPVQSLDAKGTRILEVRGVEDIAGRKNGVALKTQRAGKEGRRALNWALI